MTATASSDTSLVQALAAVDLAYSDPARARLLARSASTDSADPEVLAVAERALGLAAAASGDFAAAVRHLMNAVEGAEAAQCSTRAGEARTSLAYIRLLTSGADAALRELDRADASLGGGEPAARARMQRGLILGEIRRLPEARDCLDEALVLLDEAGGNEMLEADIRNNRAVVCSHLRCWDAAHADLDRAEALYARRGLLGKVALVNHNRGYVDAQRGELPAALVAFDAAAEGYRNAGLHPGLLSVERAEALLAVRLVAEARQAAAEAVAEFTHQRNAVDLVQARLLLAEAALFEGDTTTALTEADRARRSARRQDRPRWTALAGYLRVQARWRTGERSKSSLTAARRTAAELTDAGWVVQSLDARLIAAQIALGMGRRDIARSELGSVRSARRTGPAELRARAWHAEAVLRRAEGDRTGAARAVRAGMAILDEFQASLGATDMRAYAFTHAEDLARLGVELAVESGRAASIFAAAERGRAGALRFRPARPPDDAELAGELAELRQVVSDLWSGEVTDPASLVARQQMLEQTICDRARHATGGQSRPERAPTVSALCDALSTSMMIEYVELAGELHAVAISDGRLSFRRLGPVAGVETALDALRTGLSWLAVGAGSPKSLRAIVDVVDRRARELDDLLLSPLRSAGSTVPLVIVPTGVLHAMPWSALPSCAARAISVAPSAALWHRAATDSWTESGPVVLAHGPGLQHAAAEVSALAELYEKAASLTGVGAGVADLLMALEGAKVAHLAAHGHFRADNPMFSALRFADGPLTVYDLERLTVPPRRVVLASCDSGRASVTSGDELIGLAAALLGMGSATLIAAVIPVPDKASRALMLRFHQHLKAGCTAAAALNHARIETTGDPGDDATTAAVAAAGFLCFGAG
ncbi:MAG TPA: CHAT domain-containing protein [Jatrophihabitans sp.]|jgi:tetratricopeptide (TPR) repeat protein|nr:CHAT domain-containing protein [Jatrophihabitans sp.]